MEPGILQDVLEIVVDEIRKTVIVKSPDVPNPQIGAVSFLQNFGATLNVHPHFHLIVSDGIFFTDGDLSEVKFQKVYLIEDEIKAPQERIRMRVLKFFEKRDVFDKEELEKMLTYESSGFSLDASVKIYSWDRGRFGTIDQILCRPFFASENLRMRMGHGFTIAF